jgi:hypothetical protein
MRLSEWLEADNLAVTMRPDHSIAIPETCRPESRRRMLWDLTDYLVSGCSGGAIWLTPRPHCPLCGEYRHKPGQRC